MARLLWAVLCRRALVDQQTNTASYIDTVEEMQLASFPTEALPFIVATVWEREGMDEKLQVRFLWGQSRAKASKTLAPDPIGFPQRFHRLNVLIGGLPVPRPGRYQVTIQQKRGSRWRKEVAVPITISSMRTEPGQKAGQEGRPLTTGPHGKP
jgi:hypothetical protein